MHCIYFRILFTKAPIDSRAVRSDGTTVVLGLLFILNKGVMVKAHIHSLLYNSMECQQPQQPPLRNAQQQVTSSFSEVETDSQSDEVDRVVGSSPSSSGDESSPETDFVPEPRAETLPPSKYGQERTRVERDD